MEILIFIEILIEGGTDTPLDGELGLGTNNTVISRITLGWFSINSKR